MSWKPTVGEYPSKSDYTYHELTSPNVDNSHHQTKPTIGGKIALLTSGAKGQSLNALRIRAQSLISSLLICFLMSTRSSGGRFGSVSDLRRLWAPGANDLFIGNEENNPSQYCNLRRPPRIEGGPYPIAAFKLCPFNTNSLLKQ